MRRLVLVGAALLVMAACSAEPAPIEPKASASPHTSPRPTSALTPPLLPKQAERKDATGAANFAGYWIHVLNYAVESSDPSSLEAISMPDCEGCESYIRRIDSDRKAGTHSVGFKWTPKAAEFADSLPHRVAVKVSAAKYRRIENDHSVTAVRANQYEVGFELEWIDGGWMVRELYLP